MNTMLIMNALAAEVSMTFGERSAYALRMLLVGVLMVFVVLGLIWLVLTLMRVFAYDLPRRRAEKNAACAPKEPDAYTVPAVPVEQPAASDDGALVAAITAAITAYRDAAGESGAFRVVSFRRAESGRSWNTK